MLCYTTRHYKGNVQHTCLHSLKIILKVSYGMASKALYLHNVHGLHMQGSWQELVAEVLVSNKEVVLRYQAGRYFPSLAF